LLAATVPILMYDAAVTPPICGEITTFSTDCQRCGAVSGSWGKLSSAALCSVPSRAPPVTIHCGSVHRVPY
jgi:hypothetical protein